MKRSLLIISALMFGLLFLGGCDKEIKGPPRGNIAPVVEFVNIPVEGAQFSSDTTIYWYGTDVDGFIKYFRYAVVESSLVGPDPDLYIATTPDASIPWKVITVQLENPGTKDKVKMSADVRDPVRKFVASYIFLQAVDNLDMGSLIVHRIYRKNNHFPVTTIAANDIQDPYINAKSPGTGALNLQGVDISFSATDPIDYPRNPPPFEYQWKLFGPFNAEQMDTINLDYTDTVFVDNFGDFYHLGDFYQTIDHIDTTIDTTVIPPDTTIDTVYFQHLVDTLGVGNPYGSWSRIFYPDSLPDRFDRLVGNSDNPLTGQPWVSDQQINVYDVYRFDTVSVQADTTRLKYFVVWCQARDDSRVPDPVPDYKWISVIEPKFERDVILLDFTRYQAEAQGHWNWALFPGVDGVDPATPPMIKNVYGKLINRWRPGSFDTLNILPNETIGSYTRYYTDWKCTQDYYAVSNLSQYLAGTGVEAITLRDVLKHKIILLVKDNTTQVIDFQSLEGRLIVKGLENGMSCWSMMRRPFDPVGSIVSTFPPLFNATPSVFRELFGVQYMNFTAWAEFMSYLGAPGDPTPFGAYGQIRIEDFIGASSLFPNTLPDLLVDTLKLETRYKWSTRPTLTTPRKAPFRCPSTGEILIGAYPEVGYVAKELFSDTALYLYKSLYGTNTPQLVYTCGPIRTGNILKYEGTVVAVKRNRPPFRSAHFSFSLLPFDDENAWQVFEPMMDWLAEQPYINTGKPVAGKLSPDAQRNLESLKRISRELDALKKAGMLESMSRD